MNRLHVMILRLMLTMIRYVQYIDRKDGDYNGKTCYCHSRTDQMLENPLFSTELWANEFPSSRMFQE